MAGQSNQISNWAGGGATTTLGAAQLAYGLWKQKKNKRPNYEIPPEIQANLDQAETAALQGLPEEQKQQYLNSLKRQQTFSLAQANSRKAGLTGLAALNQQGNDAYANMLSMDAQTRMANQDKVYGMRQTLADYKDQAFQLNKSNPYYEQTAENNALIGAGMQNVSQGFQQGNSGGYDWMSKTSDIEDPGASRRMKRRMRNIDWPDQGTGGTEAIDGQYNIYPYGGVVDDSAQQGNYATEDATWNTVGQMGAIGGVIGGVANLGNAIGRPVREKNEAIDENTGQLKNYKSHQTIGGGMLNPLSALQTRSSYKGGWTDIDGSKYKQHLIDSAQPAYQASQQQIKADQDAATLSRHNTMLAQAYPEKYGNPSQFPFGGMNGGKKIVEIEKKEVVKNPDNSVYVANAPSHIAGGQKIVAKNGAMIFSDQILIPGTDITFAKRAKDLKSNPSKMNELFIIQEKHKKQNGL